jgi:hypothetical protein
MPPTERKIMVQFVAAVVLVVVFSIACAIVWTGALVPIALGTPFALFLYWQSLHVDDFRFGQHDEDTPFEPKAIDRNAISYRDIDRGLGEPHASH